MIIKLKNHFIEKKLTKTEIRVLLMSFFGLKDEEIANYNNTATKSVKSIKTMGSKKLNVKGKYELYRYCLNFLFPLNIDEMDNFIDPEGRCKDPFKLPLKEII